MEELPRRTSLTVGFYHTFQLHIGTAINIKKNPQCEGMVLYMSYQSRKSVREQLGIDNKDNNSKVK